MPAAGAEAIGPDAWLLRGLCADAAPALLEAVQEVARRAPFRRMDTRRGTMAVAMTNCGAVGWVSDRRGYRYEALDPASGKPWPPLPERFAALAARAAVAAGFAAPMTDVCLINRYAPGDRLSLHQDRDEPDLSAPIVSVSLGLPAIFLFGGTRRADPVRRCRLAHGDVVVWGGTSRLAFHGVAPVLRGEHPATGPCRINLTLRAARHGQPPGGPPGAFSPARMGG